MNNLYRKHSPFILLLSLFLIPFYSQAQVKKLSPADIKKALENNLYTLSYSDNHLEKKEAMDFILNHPKIASISFPMIKETILNADIPENNLMNLWQVFLYIKPDNSDALNCKEVSSLITKNIDKSLFLRQMLLTTTPTCKKTVFPFLAQWIKGDDPLLYITAFQIIKEVKLKEFSDFVLGVILKDSKNITKTEGGLSVINTMPLKTQKNIKWLLPLFKSSSRTIRVQVALLFSKHPEFFSTLKDQLSSSDSLLEGASIIECIGNYESQDPQYNNYLIELLSSSEAYLTEIISALKKRQFTLQNYKDIGEIFTSKTSMMLKFSILDILGYKITKPLDKNIKQALYKAFEKILNSHDTMASLKQRLKSIIKDDPYYKTLLKK